MAPALNVFAISSTRHEEGTGVMSNALITFPNRIKKNNKNQSGAAPSPTSPHPSVHTFGFLCLGFFNNCINNQISDSLPKPLQPLSSISSSRGPPHADTTQHAKQAETTPSFFPSKSKATICTPRHCPATANLAQDRWRQRGTREMQKGWKGKQREGSSAAGGQRTETGVFPC